MSTLVCNIHDLFPNSSFRLLRDIVQCALEEVEIENKNLERKIEKDGANSASNRHQDKLIRDSEKKVAELTRVRVRDLRRNRKHAPNHTNSNI